MKGSKSVAWLIGAALVLAPAAALAGTASFSLSAPAIGADTGATALSAAVGLPNSGAPSFAFNFVLPQNYVKDSVVTIVAQFHSAQASCSFVLVPTVVAHRRVGVETDFSASVLTEKNGSPVVATASATTIPFQKQYLLSPGGTLAHLKKGDQILIEVARNPSDPDDTCASSVFLEAIDVRYTTP